MPAITPKKLLKFLVKKGFYKHHQVGSHLVLKSINDPAIRVTLPMHNNDLKPGTLNSILKQAGIDKKEIFK
jgi:predicted RNA binding protein YcfA (HicA-like mRNA interferase family)